MLRIANHPVYPVYAMRSIVLEYTPGGGITTHPTPPKKRSKSQSLDKFLARFCRLDKTEPKLVE